MGFGRYDFVGVLVAKTAKFMNEALVPCLFDRSLASVYLLMESERGTRDVFPNLYLRVVTAARNR